MARYFSIVTALLFAIAVGAAETNGVLTVVKGDVSVKSGKTGKVEKAKVGTKVFSSDTVISGKDSRAKLVMADNNILNISPESELNLEKYVFNPEKNEKSVSLNLLYGKVRSTVKQKYDGEDEKFQVKTPAAVAGVRGTDFLVGFNAGSKQSQVVTFSGLVEVGKGLDASGKIANPVRVAPGQFTVAIQGTPPSAPKIMPKDQLVKMDSDSVAAPLSPSERREPAGKGEPQQGEKSGDKSSGEKKNTDKSGNNNKPDDNKPTDHKPEKHDDSGPPPPPPPPPPPSSAGCPGGVCLPPPIFTPPPIDPDKFNTGPTKLNVIIGQ